DDEVTGILLWKQVASRWSRPYRHWRWLGTASMSMPLEPLKLESVEWVSSEAVIIFTIDTTTIATIYINTDMVTTQQLH
ncbi:hypothetical protein BHE74_00030059, partial [Ensete ventricosum]